MKKILLAIGILLLAVIAAFLIYVLIMTVSAYIIKPVEYTKHSRYYRFLLNISIVMVFFVCRIHVHTEGMEKVPEGGRFLLVSNHRSNFDPLVHWYAFMKYDVAFLSKASNFKVPWFGRIIRKCCCLAIDREDPRKAIVTINKAAELIENDEVSVGVYPEGTRSRENVLLPFHNGVFKIAQKAGVPIVVTTLEGTENIYKNYIRRRSDIYLKVVDVISAEEVKAIHKSGEIGERVRTDMLENISGIKDSEAA